MMEKVVQVKVEETKFEQIETIVEKPVIKSQIKEVERVVPYISETVK